MDSVTKNAVLSRISNLRYAISELDKRYSSKLINKSTYETEGNRLVNDVKVLEDYITNLFKGVENDAK